MTDNAVRSAVRDLRGSLIRSFDADISNIDGIIKLTLGSQFSYSCSRSAGGY